MNLAQQFELLGRKQLRAEEGLRMLTQIQVELTRDAAAAKAWGLTAALANVTLIPLNVIVNALDLKAAQTAYQVLVRQLYTQYAQSGTRAHGPAQAALGALKTAIVSELKRKGLASQIPGVNILVGLAEDSLAALQVAQAVQAGGKEMAALGNDLARKIARARTQMLQLGVQRAQVLDRLQTLNRTA
jgi:hypothetical protein